MMASQKSQLHLQRRNVVVLGKTGAGKSTLANKIVGRKVFETGKQSVESVTTKPDVKETQIVVHDVQYNIKAIDTVGLFDTRGLSHDAIFKQIKDFFTDKVPEGISLVLFVFKEGRYTPEEKTTLCSFMEHFGKEKISDISALVVTCCENWDSSQRTDYVSNLKSNKLMQPIVKFMQKGIICVGFPDLDRINPRLRNVFEESAKEDEAVLHKLIQGCEDTMIMSKEIWDKVESASASSGYSLCTIL